MSAHAVDSTAEDITDVPAGAAAVAEPAPVTALAVRERRSEVIRPLDTDELVASFQAYQQLVPRLLNAGDYQDAGRGKRFVKKSGWRKIAAAFDLDVLIVRSVVERDADGQPLRAEVWARAVAPSGRAMDGDGYCDLAEERFKDASGRKKLENDLRATATTRAMNRAISGLIGMGDDGDEPPAAGSLPYGEAAEAGIVKSASTAMLTLCGGDVDLAHARWDAIRKTVGYMPHAVAVALCLAAGFEVTA